MVEIEGEEVVEATKARARLKSRDAIGRQYGDTGCGPS